MSTKKKKQRLSILRLVILTLAALSVVFGIVYGEAEVVLLKASNICMECIGIG